MATIREKPLRPRGRPSKEEEVRQALAEAGCDPMAIDPLRILASIAVNRSMPPTARVAACRVLIAARDPARAEASAAAAADDALAVRAQELLAARRRAN
jgi:hypothetical protein